MVRRKEKRFDIIRASSLYELVDMLNHMASAGNMVSIKFVKEEMTPEETDYAIHRRIVYNVEYVALVEIEYEVEVDEEVKK